MTGQQLKNSILQMAVQGKLVPQDPNDEPASVLLERIRKEKEQLIKEGKIKKEKNTSYIFRGADNLPYEKVGKSEPVCIADEVPFDIPESWEWVRLGRIVYNRGQMKPNDDFCYIDIGSIDNKNQKLSDEENILAADRAPSRARKIVSAGDILYSTVRPYLHNMCIIDRSFSHQPIASTGFAALSCHTGYYNEFLFYYLMSPDFDAYANDIDNAKGVAYPAINDKKLYQALIPVPPELEQKRIVEKFKEVLPYIDAYGTAYSEIDALNAAFPDCLKKSILQEAVQGKLVPQDPADEPASVLLDRIRAEKERLIKEGKIKRDKHESVIFRRDNSHYEKRGSKEVCIDDELPFDIPENWCWSRLSTLCKSISDGDHQPPPQVPSGIPFVVISNVSSGKIDLSNTRFVSHDYYENLHESRIPCRDDILFTVTGSYGIVIPVDTEDAFCFQRHIALLKPLQITTEFLSTWLNTPIVYEQCKHCATGTAQKTVGLNSLKNILIPIPPINEQVRILEQLEEVLPLIAL